jgi:asparagine synthase (glutamine-hydrolysing)
VVSRLASRSRKVVLGGQGGDEIFGGYARYLIACLQPCVAGAIDETLPDGSFAVPSESIPPDHVLLRQYEPLLRELQSEGSSDELDRRYFQLIRRTPPDADEVRWSLLGDHSPFEVFREIFRGDTACESPVDCMMRFDFGTLLPALLHVEDRMSMAHGVESRVPFLDHPLVELVATVPSSIKLQRGELKHLLKRATRRLLPREVAERRDKMGFPVPLNEWIRGDARDFVHDVLSSARAVERELIDNRRVLARIDQEPRYGRRMWGFLSLELWQQELLDNAARFEAPA